MRNYEGDLAREVAILDEAAEVARSQSQAAERLGWDLERVRARVHRGQILSVSLPGSRLIPNAEVERLLAEQSGDVPHT